MDQIFLERPSPEFTKCWSAAASHIKLQLEKCDQAWPSGRFYNWHKSDLRPPFLEHLSFRLGNQLFFVRVEDVDNEITAPGSVDGLNRIAASQGGYACIMPMKSTRSKWTPAADGWGLLNIVGRKAIDPVALVNSEPVEMTDWEVHDLAVDLVCMSLKHEKREIIIAQSSPELDPSVWFIHPHWGPAWVAVRAVRYPNDLEKIPLPAIWHRLLEFGMEKGLKLDPEKARKFGTRGYFAQVCLAANDEKFEGSPQPLLRGWHVIPFFAGLAKAQSANCVFTGSYEPPIRPLGWFLLNQPPAPGTSKFKKA